MSFQGIGRSWKVVDGFENLDSTGLTDHHSRLGDDSQLDLELGGPDRGVVG